MRIPVSLGVSLAYHGRLNYTLRKYFNRCSQETVLKERSTNRFIGEYLHILAAMPSPISSVWDRTNRQLLNGQSPSARLHTRTN